jgi:hypothetical protein
LPGYVKLSVTADLDKPPGAAIDEVQSVDIEDRLKRLQSLFTYALSGAVAAKARYLALRGDLSSTPAAVARAKMTWQQLEARKTAIISRMVALEELEQLEASERPEALEQDFAREHAA